MRKLKVGIIGTGMAFERLHYPAYQKLSDRYEITALCDVDGVKVRKWAGRLNLDPTGVYTDFHAMLGRDDLDVIDIMVPIELNFRVTEAVARRLAGRRKGIVCEKPLAATMDEARAARDLARTHRIPIMIAENFRYDQEIDTIRDLVRTRRIGEVYYFLQNRAMNFPRDMPADKFEGREWRQHPEFPGGVILDSAVHDLAALRHIFGAIDRLQAFGRPQAADFAPYAVVNVNLLFKSGVTGQFSFFCAGREMQRPLTGLRIFGSAGMIFWEERDAGTINLAFDDGRHERITCEVQKGYYNELLNFYNALTGTEPVSVPPEMEYGDMKTVEDILRSIREGQIVAVDEQADYRPSYGQRDAPAEHYLQ
ncbi:MAG: Gfo/Idh/MocA family oxidoreductase [Peptococcaceae bacterium]|jgi:predicted dehydrogenase|nr:Gfo/Idh/MocA family oxidoreductase [Peptococcaceae bacterium]